MSAGGLTGVPAEADRMNRAFARRRWLAHLVARWENRLSDRLAGGR